MVTKISVTHYRVKCKCEKCGAMWTTRKKDNNFASSHCPDCGSCFTVKLRSWPVPIKTIEPTMNEEFKCPISSDVKKGMTLQVGE